MAANDTQVQGTHYKNKAIQPWDYISSNNLGYLEGNVVKYVSRWKEKGGYADLQKARHYLDKLIEIEGMKPKENTNDLSNAIVTGPIYAGLPSQFPVEQALAKYNRSGNVYINGVPPPVVPHYNGEQLASGLQYGTDAYEQYLKETALKAALNKYHDSRN